MGARASRAGRIPVSLRSSRSAALSDSLRRAAQLLPALLLIAAAIFVGARVPRIHGTASPPDTFLVLAAITALTIAIVILLRRQLGISTQSALPLPLPLYTVYFAAAVLGGTSGAVVLAAVASLYHLVGEGGRRTVTYARIVTTLRGAAVAALTILCAGSLYVVLASTLRIGDSALHTRMAADLGATVVVLVGASLSRMLDSGFAAIWSGAAWSAFLRSPAFRFQVLLLSMGPLLPLVDVLDDFQAELAWVLFLVPLYAIYYLALLSARLQERTEELQKTVEALAAARERQAELSGYAALVTRAQEEERRRLARELHDDTAQALIALTRGLDAMATRLVEPPLPRDDRRFLEELGQLATHTLDGIRRACQNLRPSVLDDLGLAAALESLVGSMGAQGLPCRYEQVGEPLTCAPEVEVTLYRIAQEALSNALRHARASAVVVELTYAADALRLVVRDNGRGFGATPQPRMAYSPDTDEGAERPHLGLMGMRERAALIGATLTVASRPGIGTTVVLLVPLHDRKPAAPAFAG
jgi:signal transduction histidine kinase